jgi:hypothetical protein
MNSESVSHEELVEPSQVEIDGMENSSSKIVPDNKSNLKKHTTESIEESKEHISDFSKIFSLKRQIFTSENDKGNLLEESKYDQKNIKISLQECEDTVINKDKATSKEKDFPDNEEKSEKDYSKEKDSENNKTNEFSQKIQKLTTQVEECCYLKLKTGDEFYLEENSCDLHTHNLRIGSKIRLAIGNGLINHIKNNDHVRVALRDSDLLDTNRCVKIIDAVILPPLEEIRWFWYEERNIFASIFGNNWSVLLFPFLLKNDKEKRLSGNLILDQYFKEKLFLDRLLWHYRYDKVTSHYSRGSRDTYRSKDSNESIHFESSDEFIHSQNSDKSIDSNDNSEKQSIDCRFTLYEVKEGKLVRPIDNYILNKPLDYNDKFDFTFKEHKLNVDNSKEYYQSYYNLSLPTHSKNKSKKFTELHYQSAFKDDYTFRI